MVPTQTEKTAGHFPVREKSGNFTQILEKNTGKVREKIKKKKIQENSEKHWKSHCLSEKEGTMVLENNWYAVV